MAKTTVRAPMPPSRRAKQFAPFDALTGLKEAIAAQERITVPKKELAEDRKCELNMLLQELHKGQLVSVVFYGAYEENYIQQTGYITKIDFYWKSLVLDSIGIDFSEIYEIIIHEKRNERC